jgi:hypothetical protein
MHLPINFKSPNNISKLQMGFNSAFKGLNIIEINPVDISVLGSESTMRLGYVFPPLCVERIMLLRPVSVYRVPDFFPFFRFLFINAFPSFCVQSSKHIQPLLSQNTPQLFLVCCNRSL